MKVAELIKALEKQPQDIEVRIGWGVNPILDIRYYDKPEIYDVMKVPYVCLFD